MHEARLSAIYYQLAVGHWNRRTWVAGCILALVLVASGVVVALYPARWIEGVCGGVTLLACTITGLGTWRNRATVAEHMYENWSRSHRDFKDVWELLEAAGAASSQIKERVAALREHQQSLTCRESSCPIQRLRVKAERMLYVEQGWDYRK